MILCNKIIFRLITVHLYYFLKYLTLHISDKLYEFFTIKQIEQSELVKLNNYKVLFKKS